MLEYLLCVAVISACILIAFQSYTGAKNGPPGPKGYPFFGVIFEVDVFRLHEKLYEWTQQYGDVFQFQMLGKKFLCINSVEVLRETFLQEPCATINAYRSPTFTGKYLLKNYSDVIFASPSSLWEKRRKFVYRLLHTYGEGITSLENQVLQNLIRFKGKIRQNISKDVNPFEIVDEFILSTIETLIIGRSFGKEGPLQPLLKLEEELANRLANPGTDGVLRAFPFLRFLPLPMSSIYHEAKSVHQQLLDKLETLSKEDCEDTGIYHTMKKALKERDENGNAWFNDDNIYGVLFNISGAAYLTTRGTLLSAINILAKRLELQNSLQREVDSVIGRNREPRLSDRKKCPLMEAVVMETLRYISHVPLLVLHANSQSTTIGGYSVEKDTVIIPNSWTMHHSEKYWDEPFSFKPERFLDEDGQLLPATDPVRKRFASFGLGKRSCIGEVFAKSRIFLFLSSLMQMATIAEPEGKRLPDLDPRKMIPGIVLQPQEYEVRFLMR
ncbi:steroid 17-alpha-hydroxylase/17,20 lyase isoform X1 [Magallana gigas]|uniref:steroid 17-alpha-hydroxylase/17,20 lyase isoform X1 n=1 Tax=Magallana gigas TaxID=29159 RepID=UPI00333EFBFA